MITIRIKFVTGKYHATPWGRYVNEGISEWPPSPYRLLRAIIASWKYNLPDIKEKQIFQIIKKLSSKTPEFYLPQVSFGHTRHYMLSHKKTSNLIFDTFVVINKTEMVYLTWSDVEINNEETKVLKDILKHIHYFGRSESWCDMELCDVIKDFNCIPLQSNKKTDKKFWENTEIVEVMTPKSDIVMDDLYTITANLRIKEKRIYPKGSQIIQYLKKIERTGEKKKTQISENVQVVRYAIINTLKPQNTDALRIAEIFRNAAQSKFGKINNKKSSQIFSGKDQNGKKLTGHNHAFYIPTDEDDDGKIDHITVIAKHINTEFGKELDSLLNIMKLYSGYHLEETLDLVIESYGSVDDFQDLPIFKTSKRWCSFTPFVLSRHIKWKCNDGSKYQINLPEEQIKNELEQRHNVQNVKIKFTNPKKRMKSRFYPFQFKRFRKNDRPGGGAYNVMIEFEQPFAGPIILGYGAHFGLGLFIPE